MDKVRLSELGQIVTGNTPKKSKKENYESNEIKFFKPGNFKGNQIAKLDFTDTYISEKARKEARIIPKGSILVTCIGTIGKVGILEEEATCNQQINAIIPNDKVISKYLAYLLLEKAEYLKSKANAPVVPIINKTDFSNIEIIIHKKDEQQKIVDKLDEIQDIIDIRKKQIEDLDNLIKSRFVELFGDLVINDKEYPIAKLSYIAEYFNGLTYKSGNVSEEGTIVLRSSNIKDSSLDFNDIVRVQCIILNKLIVRDNDILMCSRNGSARLVGKVALIKNSNEPMSFGAFMMIIRSTYYAYLMTYFQLGAFRKQIVTGATTTINQITGRMLDQIELPIPDQNTLQEYELFFKQINKLKFEIKNSLEEIEKLQKVLINKYFS